MLLYLIPAYLKYDLPCTFDSSVEAGIHMVIWRGRFYSRTGPESVAETLRRVPGLTYGQRLHHESVLEGNLDCDVDNSRDSSSEPKN
jgi:hypothetical protein